MENQIIRPHMKIVDIPVVLTVSGVIIKEWFDFQRWLYRFLFEEFFGSEERSKAITGD
jgi:hypothetical protein